MRVFVVAVLGCLVALLGVRAAVGEWAPVDLFFGVAVGCAFAMSCFADARRLGKPLPSGAGFAIMALWPIAVPIYFLSSRGLRQGGLLALAVLAAELGLYFGGYCIASFAVWGDVVF